MSRLNPIACSDQSPPSRKAGSIQSQGIPGNHGISSSWGSSCSAASPGALTGGDLDTPGLQGQPGLMVASPICSEIRSVLCWVLERGDRASQECHQHQGTRQTGQTQLWRPREVSFSSISVALLCLLPHLRLIPSMDSKSYTEFWGCRHFSLLRPDQRLDSNLLLTMQKAFQNPFSSAMQKG